MFRALIFVLFISAITAQRFMDSWSFVEDPKSSSEEDSNSSSKEDSNSSSEEDSKSSKDSGSSSEEEGYFEDVDFSSAPDDDDLVGVQKVANDNLKYLNRWLRTRVSKYRLAYVYPALPGCSTVAGINCAFKQDVQDAFQTCISEKNIPDCVRATMRPANQCFPCICWVSKYIYYTPC